MRGPAAFGFASEHGSCSVDAVFDHRTDAGVSRQIHGHWTRSSSSRRGRRLAVERVDPLGRNARPPPPTRAHSREAPTVTSGPKFRLHRSSTSPRSMLSLDECRRVLGSLADNKSDDEIARMREQAEAVARVVIRTYIGHQRAASSPASAAVLSGHTQDSLAEQNGTTNESKGPRRRAPRLSNDRRGRVPLRLKVRSAGSGRRRPDEP